jgi:diadenosine tetraphosphate (Ap4A) HIT family hydrolase
MDIFAPAWSLHPQLERDTTPLGDLPLSRVLIINDANYPWLLLVPRRADAVEVIDLDEVERAQLMTRSRSSRRAQGGDRNATSSMSAALGNAVPQLHVHVIARRKTDKAWPKPVWGVVPPLSHDAKELDRFMNAMKKNSGFLKTRK